ncbi:MAG: DIP1984 family protein [Dehalococcoidia bacterium]
MKLAEALVSRADMQKRMSQLKQRAMNSATYQEGSAPAEDPVALRADYDRMAAELASLVERINRTNLSVTIPSGQSITAAIAERDSLQLRRGFLADLASTANSTQVRMLRTELRMVSAVPIAEFQRDADDLARRFRELDTSIQATNWSVDLLD